MADISSFHRTLYEWYRQYGRSDLPWRNSDDPYVIYISEVMLQQTQVKTVLEHYYFPFLQQFPTLQALANAPLDAVLKQWEGLGYYSRAANLHKAAQMAAPNLPHTVDGLLKLPGVGQNTAHAIAAFAYGQPVAVLEANVKRVIARLFALEKTSPADLWRYAGQLVDEDNPFDYNQAMMDMGALVCRPKEPQCGVCPANKLCKGKQSPQSYPAKKARKAIPIRKKEIAVFRNADGLYYLTPRETRFLGGLYGFKEYDQNTAMVYFENRAYDLQRDGTYLGELNQTYSHFKLQANLWLLETPDTGGGEGWFTKDEITSLALSGADHKALKILEAALPKALLQGID